MKPRAKRWSGWSAWRRPTLVRRVVLSLFAAFALVFLVLLGFLYHGNSKPERIDRTLATFNRSLLATIGNDPSDTGARAAAMANAAMFNDMLASNGVPSRVVAQLAERRGRVLYTTPGADRHLLAAAAGASSVSAADGQVYRVLRSDTEQWTLIVAQRQLADSWMLIQLALDLIEKMGIAFPLVLLPIWLAVTRGLRPLLQLSKRIGDKSPDDLTALGIDTHYAELQPLTDALDRLLAQMRGKIAREHAFVQDAAHELRTPMAVIAAQAHVLVKAGSPEQRADAGQRLELAIGRASHLTRQLLELARIDSEQQQAAARFDVAQMVRYELALLAPAAMARDIDLSLEAPDVLLHTFEPHSFQSILQNLLTNALRYVQQGGRVLVELRAHGAGLRLSVADNGPGIPAAQRAQVFERFYRGPDHDVSGTGLGLAIVAQASARLAARIRLADGLDGAGCTFAVDFPAEIAK